MTKPLNMAFFSDIIFFDWRGNMSKVAVIINNIKEAKDIQDYIDAFLLPIENLSINYIHTFSLEQIKEIKKLNKEIFIIINKNIHNKELFLLEKTLKEIENLNINGIVFYDIALVNLKQKMHLKTPLVWNQEHLTTNYGTVNYWYNKGVEYAYLSSELTKREIDEIKNNAKAKLFVNVFGYIPMFTSKRHLVNNYLETFNLKSKHQNTIRKEGKIYPINDTNLGTTVYSNYILNAVDIDFNKIDYLVFNSNLIDEKDFINVLKDYKEKQKNKFPKETGFLYQETIYKVK